MFQNHRTSNTSIL